MAKPGDQPETPPRTITVTGTGRIQVVPDLVDLRLGVTITGPTVGEARVAAATTMSAIIDVLRGAGIADRDLRTSVVSVSPAYDYSSNTNPPRIAGYTVTNLVATTLRDVGKLGAAIDGALEAGATSIDRLAFGVSNQFDVEQQARSAAMADARAKADTLAAAAGLSIVGIATIAEAPGAVPYPAQLAEMKAMASRDTSTPIESGMNEVEVTVSVAFLID